MKVPSRSLCATVLAGLATIACGHADVESAVEETSSAEEILSMPATAEARVAADRARWGDHYADRMALFLEETPHLAPGGTVFLGDSITEGFPLDAVFPGQNVVNRGIGGDTIEGLTERLDVCVEALAPRRVYVMIGTNNLWWASPNATTDDLAALCATLLDRLRAAAPQALVTVQSVLPSSGDAAGMNPRTRALNERLKQLAESRGMIYLDLQPLMADSEGRLRDEFTTDGIHLTAAGYEAWLEGLLPPEEFFDAALNLWARSQDLYLPARVANAVDPPREGQYPGSRGPDELIVYTPAYGHSTTGTNEWGFEAVVDNGTVVAAGGNDSAIPAHGFVVSGHGRAAQWVDNNLKPGVRVVLDGRTVRREPASTGSLNSEERLAAMRTDTLSAALTLRERGAAQETLSEASALLREILALRREPAGATPERLAALEHRVGALQRALEGEPGLPAAPQAVQH